MDIFEHETRHRHVAQDPDPDTDHGRQRSRRHQARALLVLHLGNDVGHDRRVEMLEHVDDHAVGKRAEPACGFHVVHQAEVVGDLLRAGWRQGRG